MQERQEVVPGTIFCKDGTVRIIKGILKNYSEVGKFIEGDNYRSSTTDAVEHEAFERPLKDRRSEEEVASLKAEKHTFKQVMRLKYPELAAQGLSADKIWELTCVRSGKTD